MEEKQYTIKEVLELTIKNLGSISVPVSMKNEIAEPIERAIGNINACLDAMARQESAARESQDTASQAWQEEEK